MSQSQTRRRRQLAEASEREGERGGVRGDVHSESRVNKMRSTILVSVAFFVLTCVGFVVLLQTARQQASTMVVKQDPAEPYKSSAVVNVDNTEMSMVKRDEQKAKRQEFFESAIDWIDNKLEEFIKSDGQPFDSDTVDMNVGAVAVLFDVVDQYEADDDARIEDALDWIRKLYTRNRSKEMIGTFVNDLGCQFSFVKAREGEKQSLYYRESLALLEEALKIRKEVYGEIHPGVAQTYINMATIMEKNNDRPDRYAKLGRRGYDILLRSVGPNDPRTKNAKADWART